MSAIITPYVVNETGVAVFPVDKPTSNYIGAGRRFLISPLPREQAENTPDGVVDLNYSLVANQSLAPFFQSERVFNALGGEDSLVHWVSTNIHDCQAHDKRDCSHQLTTHFYNGSAVRLCWKHDAEYMMKGYGKLEDQLSRNRANWIMNWAASELKLPPDRDLSMVELTFWAIRRNLKDELPDEAGRIAFCQPKTEIPTGTLKESDITWEHSTRELVDITAEQIVNLSVDEDSGLLYMRRPKAVLGKSPAYLRFVVSRPCIGCGGKVNHPFMYRARSLNEHDRWAVPLCDDCARSAENDVRAWEKAHGIRLYVAANQLFDFAIERGVITFNN
ncbi:TPA: DUF968 domain-containing protein [Escherichia coli]|uniref:DUF968 domain-containing protein n=1 Tax=Escherichia coli TaxID=562 RepID=A0A3U0QQP7_ECOLX|nr:DUF968 domain-containing protein [Escherichia coli]EBA3297110.1 DUF968 domain-containing protein [Salmonella enterica]EBF6938579.1 DUF968 domain-containing protein [Salmonella enterica subsp. enterica serovar Concord]EBV1354350.1 DUF968 domain-containing protein [Salmonella enterica subsp. enterica serovar Infantis]ECF7383604.1 DUF968 domain-containing protein [Salmonella enterica subsp. enterica]EDR3003427.1 DUF968 domain-containing protein [Salmonella enterica subsp. enterica serovar Mban